MIQHVNKRPANAGELSHMRLHNRPRVFALEPCGKLDIADAGRYGQVWYLFTESRKRPNLWSADFCQATLAALQEQDYNPEADYVLVIGPMANLALFLCKVAAKFGRIKLLLWCALENEYVARYVVGR